MAMTMTGEVQLPATRQAVWDKLNDPEVLKACIPGCEELEKTDENGFRATAKMKVGPVSARFKGKVTLSDLDPPNGYRISGEGEGGVAGEQGVVFFLGWCIPEGHDRVAHEFIDGAAMADDRATEGSE